MWTLSKVVSTFLHQHRDIEIVSKKKTPVIWRRGTRLLSIERGCGHIDYANELSERPLTILGIDFSQENCSNKVCKKRSTCSLSYKWKKYIIFPWLSLPALSLVLLVLYFCLFPFLSIRCLRKKDNGVRVDSVGLLAW